jgi:hypothetical protein
MGASSAPRYDLNSAPLGLQPYGMAATTEIQGGVMTMFNASGYLVPAADTTGCHYAGIAMIPAGAVNANTGLLGSLYNAGSAGALNCMVEPPGRAFEANASGADVSWLGKPAYATDDHTVAITSSYTIQVGYIRAIISSTKVVVGAV